MKNNMKKIAALLIAGIMMMSLIPLTALAEGEIAEAPVAEVPAPVVMEVPAAPVVEVVAPVVEEVIVPAAEAVAPVEEAAPVAEEAAPAEETVVPAAEEEPVIAETAEETEIPAEVEETVEEAEATAAEEAEEPEEAAAEEEAEELEEIEEEEIPLAAPVTEEEEEEDESCTMVLTAETPVRTAPNGMAPIVCVLEAGTEVSVIAEEGDWTAIRLEDGSVGYIYKESSAEEMQAEGKTETPKTVTIFSSRRTVMNEGETVYLTSVLEGFEDCEQIVYVWKVDKGAGFEEIEGANGNSHSFAATAESLSWGWHLTVLYC